MTLCAARLAALRGLPPPCCRLASTGDARDTLRPRAVAVDDVDDDRVGSIGPEVAITGDGIWVAG